MSNRGLGISRQSRIPSYSTPQNTSDCPKIVPNYLQASPKAVVGESGLGIVWPILYVMMGVAAFLIWRKGIGSRQVRTALGLFLVQLVLNGLWTPIFFGLHMMGLALAEIILLWLAILATIVGFWRLSKVAACLLIPYILWVSFAIALNAALWNLNR